MRGLSSRSVNSSRPAISIITITCREEAGFKRCADTLAAAGQKVPFEWVVVDERYTPGRHDRAKLLHDAVRSRFPFQHVFPNLSDVRLRGLPDPNRARNEGLRIARGDYIAFLDDNMAVSKGWLTHIDEARRQGWGFRSRLAYQPDNGALPTASFERVWERITSARQCSGIFGAPRAAFFEIGGFDEAYAGEMGCEDLDCVARLMAAGLPFYTSRGSLAVHYTHEKISATLEKGRNRARFEELLRCLSLNTDPHQREELPSSTTSATTASKRPRSGAVVS